MTIRFASERDIAHPEEGKEDVRNVPHDKRPANVHAIVFPCYTEKAATYMKYIAPENWYGC